MPATGRPACPEVPECTIASAFGDSNPETICTIVRATIAARGSGTWSNVQRDAWHAACIVLMSGPPRIPDPPPVVEVHINPCRGLHELHAQRDAMVGRSLSDDAWVAFGSVLAACTPMQRPWETLGLSGRSQFMTQYIVPYVNNDVQSGGRFQTSAVQAYAMLVRRWLGDG